MYGPPVEGFTTTRSAGTERQYHTADHTRPDPVWNACTSPR